MGEVMLFFLEHACFEVLMMVSYSELLLSSRFCSKKTDLSWFACTKTKFEGEMGDRDNKKIHRSTSGAAFANIKLWRSSPPVRTELLKVFAFTLDVQPFFIHTDKAVVDKGMRYRQDKALFSFRFVTYGL